MVTPINKPLTPPSEKHIHWQKRWMVYSKEGVMDKLMENLDTLIKYFTACEEEKKDIIYSETMNNYIKSRLQNIHNLISMIEALSGKTNSSGSSISGSSSGS